jgi:hypothetical protein
MKGLKRDNRKERSCRRRTQVQGKRVDRPRRSLRLALLEGKRRISLPKAGAGDLPKNRFRLKA